MVRPGETQRGLAGFDGCGDEVHCKLENFQGKCIFVLVLLQNSKTSLKCITKLFSNPIYVSVRLLTNFCFNEQK